MDEIKKYKKEILETLEKEQERLAKALIMTEADYLTLTSLFMGNRKSDTNTLAEQTRLSRQKEEIETKIRQVRGLISDVEKDKIVIG